MAIMTLSSQALKLDLMRALEATKNGPVFITDRGEPARVLLGFEDYQRLTKPRRNIADALAMPGAAEVEFEPPRLTTCVRPSELLGSAHPRPGQTRQNVNDKHSLENLYSIGSSPVAGVSPGNAP